MKKNIKILMGVIALVGTTVANADSFNQDLTITSKVAKVCHIKTQDVDFGAYNPSSPDFQYVNGEVSIKCTQGTAWNFYQYSAYYEIATLNDIGGKAVKANPESANSSNVAAMIGPNSSKLYYQVQVSDGKWDNDIDLSTSVNSGHYLGVGNKQFQIINPQYRIFPGQYVGKGSYADTQTVLVDF